MFMVYQMRYFCLNCHFWANTFSNDNIDPRSLFILVQNPIFASQSTYTIFAHLLQHITTLNNADHQVYVQASLGQRSETFFSM